MKFGKIFACLFFLVVSFFEANASLPIVLQGDHVVSGFSGPIVPLENFKRFFTNGNYEDIGISERAEGNEFLVLIKRSRGGGSPTNAQYLNIGDTVQSVTVRNLEWNGERKKVLFLTSNALELQRRIVVGKGEGKWNCKRKGTLSPEAVIRRGIIDGITDGTIDGITEQVFSPFEVLFRCDEQEQLDFSHLFQPIGARGQLIAEFVKTCKSEHNNEALGLLSRENGPAVQVLDKIKGMPDTYNLLITSGILKCNFTTRPEDLHKFYEQKCQLTRIYCGLDKETMRAELEDIRTFSERLEQAFFVTHPNLPLVPTIDETFEAKLIDENLFVRDAYCKAFLLFVMTKLELSSLGRGIPRFLFDHKQLADLVFHISQRKHRHWISESELPWDEDESELPRDGDGVSIRKSRKSFFVLRNGVGTGILYLEILSKLLQNRGESCVAKVEIDNSRRHARFFEITVLFNLEGLENTVVGMKARSDGGYVDANAVTLTFKKGNGRRNVASMYPNYVPNAVEISEQFKQGQAAPIVPKLLELYGATDTEFNTQMLLEF
jgi:hypothetical protein